MIRGKLKEEGGKEGMFGRIRRLRREGRICGKRKKGRREGRTRIKVWDVNRGLRQGSDKEGDEGGYRRGIGREGR